MSALVRPSLQSIGTSMFSTFTRLAEEHGAINLAQGFPDFNPPADLIAGATEAMHDGANQYSPPIGVAPLRYAIADHAREQHGLVYDPDREITVTAGTTEAIWSAIVALIEPGDEAIVIDPCYELYGAAVAILGGIPRYVPVSPFPEFRLDLDLLERTFNERTRIVFVNTPTNPTGRVLTGEELRAIGELAERYDAYVVSDEAYENITYDGFEHVPVAADPRCRERTIMASSISKTFSATGWRIGWFMAPAQITEVIRKVHQFVLFSAPQPLQRGAAAMFAAARGSDYYDRLRAEYTERRDLFMPYLREAGLDVGQAPKGGYFIMTRCSSSDDAAFCRQLIERARVAAIPGSLFYSDPTNGPGLVRFAFCKRMETLREAGERLIAAMG
jgi:aspartate/methionine/tyrosine aminotransferase